MSALSDLRSGLGRAWDSIAEGWQNLQERASEALTRFHPTRASGELETVEEQLARRGPRWSLLAAEVKDEADDIVVKLEAPGLEPDDFEVRVEAGVLTVAGEKRFERESRKGNYYTMERAYGRFRRVIQLPAEVDESGAKAKYRRGVLTISLPKQASAKARRISVTPS